MRSENKKILKIAHRGYSALYPENTMESFRAAAEAGADMIEFDVHLSKDNRLVIIHDDTVDRTSDGSGYAGRMTFDELRGLDFSMGRGTGARIPLLEEVLDEFKNRMLMNIEIKNLPVKYNGIEARIAETVSSMGCEESVIVSSFDHNSLLKIKKIMPSLRTGMLYEAAWLCFEEEISRLAPYSLHPEVDTIDADQLMAASKKGYRIYTWVAKTRFEIERSIEFGFIDGIMVNDLNLFDGLM
jgi:glycerophosphoryl diester phosphodiesterase